MLLCELKGGMEAAKLIKIRKKLKAKRMNPKASKTSTMGTIGTGVDDTAASHGSSTHGSRYQASLGSSNARLEQ